MTISRLAGLALASSIILAATPARATCSENVTVRFVDAECKTVDLIASGSTVTVVIKEEVCCYFPCGSGGYGGLTDDCEPGQTHVGGCSAGTMGEGGPYGLLVDNDELAGKFVVTDQRCDGQVVLRYDGDLQPGKRHTVFRGNMGWASIEVASDWQSPDVGCSVAGRISASSLPYLALALFLVIARRRRGR